MRRLIKGGRIIDPAQKMDKVGHLIIEDERVAAILRPEQPLPEDIEVIQADGKWVVPGLIDMHVHLRQPGHEYKEDVASGIKAAAAGGFTTIACMPNTNPINDNASVTELIMEAASNERSVRVKVIAAATVRSEGKELTEYGELSSLGVVGVSDDGKPIANPAMLRRILEYASNFGLRVIDHPEEPTLTVSGQINEGIVSTRTGLQGIPAAAEEIAVFRDISISKLTGLPIHLAHISTAGSVELIKKAKKDKLPVTAETAPHYFTLTDEAAGEYDTSAKMNPPLRTAADCDAIKKGLAEGVIDCIATDHAPHSTLEKDLEFDSAAFGIIGLETALPLSLALVREKIITPSALVAALSTNPASILGLAGGTLQPGSPADVTIIDPDTKYSIDPNNFKSKSRNTPFAGWKVQGKALMTIVRGRTVYKA